MSTIATLAVKLIADTADYVNGMDKARHTAQTTAENISKNLKNVGNEMMDFGKKATTYVTLPIIGLGAYTIKAASDLNETKNKVQVIFGDMTQAVLDWSVNSDVAMGQSQQQALDNVSTMALWAKQANLSGDAATKFAESNVQLASDMASFFNTSPQEALEAISSAYEGITRPIRGYNILLDENSIKQQAVQMGLIGANDDLSQQARILAVNALIMKQTTEAQGDFARTADGLANSQRILTAQFQNAAAQLGAQLLPYAIQLVHWLSQAVTWFQTLSPETQKWIVVALGIAAVIGPAIVVIGALITAIGAIIPVATAIAGVLAGPVGIAIAVVIGLLALLYFAWTNNWGGIQQKTGAVIAYIQNIIQGLARYWDSVLWPAMLRVWGWMSGTLFPLFQAIGGFLGAAFRLAITVLAGAWQNILQPALASVWNQVSSKLMPIFKSLGDFWNNTLLPAIKTIAGWISNQLVGAFNSLNSIIKTVTDWINNLTEALNSITLPASLTPGSPTPFEIGLWGIRDALKAVSGTELPSLGVSLKGMNVPTITGGRTQNAGSNGGFVLQNYGRVDLHVDGNGNVDVNGLIRQLRGASL